MNNRFVFVDSSVLIEYYKNAQTELLDRLLDTKEIQICISQIVVSEYLFHCLGVDGGKSPLSVKQSSAIANVLSNGNHATFLKQYTYLQDSDFLLERVPVLMSKYNLLPNDAIIIATCQLNQIAAIASYDPDFIKVCKDLNIMLLQTLADFEIFIQNIT